MSSGSPQALPWVRVDEAYGFETSAGPRTLPELFAGRSQLLVYHLMFGPEDSVPCLGCSYTADNLDGAVFHLADHDVTFVAVSRAPLEKLSSYRRRSGWSFAWVSAFGTDFNVDFGIDVLARCQRSQWRGKDRVDRRLGVPQPLKVVKREHQRACLARLRADELERLTPGRRCQRRRAGQQRPGDHPAPDRRGSSCPRGDVHAARRAAAVGRPPRRGADWGTGAGD